MFPTLIYLFSVVALIGRIGPATHSFADAQGNFALADDCAQDDSALHNNYVRVNSLRVHLAMNEFT